MGEKCKRRRVAWPLLWLLALPAMASAAKDETPVDCNPALERFLPGAYDFCLAVRDYQRGHYRSGLDWALLAAGWAEKKAQFALGIAYFNGGDVPADRPQGLAWLTLAAERQDPYYQAILASARSHASAAELAQADAWLAKLRPKYADAFAAPRAQRHFDREMKVVRDAAWAPTDSEIYIDGLGEGTALNISKQLEDIGAGYFQGWHSHVTIGKLNAQAPPKNTP